MPGSLTVGLNIGCSIYRPKPKHCWVCSKPLPPRRRKYCSDACGDTFYANHIWGFARPAAVNRDKGKCVKCGSQKKLEVNHIIPRVGKGYGFGCHHHQANLETLCHVCHVKVTNQQRQGRAEKWSKGIPSV